MTLKRLAALLLCAALTVCMLAGCSDTGSTSASGDSIPSETAKDAVSSIVLDDDENTILDITDPASAFEPCLGWGPGTAGTSLKSVRAAASLLSWAESCKMSRQSPETIKEVFTKWYKSIDDTQQESLADAWPLIKADAQQLLKNKSSMEDLIEDAGLKADDLPGCTAKNWKALQSVLDECIPASSEA